MAALTAGVSSEARPDWDYFCHRYLTRRSGDSEALHRVLGADPGFAVGRGIAAILASVGGDASFDKEVEVEAARAARPGQDWEQSFVAAATTTAEQGPWAAYDAWLAHAEQFPGDLLGFRFASFLTTASTAPDLLERAERLLRRTAAAVGEHTMLLGLSAMLAQEQGRLDDAAALAARCLELDPTGTDGAHPMSHVHFEHGDHADGLAFLDGWFAGVDEAAPFHTHLVWHAALHELQLGRGEAALERYAACTVPGPSQLADGPSLLWRCQLLGYVAPGADPAEPRMSDVVAPMRARVPMTFVGAHVALALASAEDAEALRRFAADAADFTAPGAAELLPDLALGLAAYVEGDHAAACDALGRRAGDFVRLGGSHAQREVFEDTLVHALTRAGRHDEATRLIEARLDRRPSPLDTALLPTA